MITLSEELSVAQKIKNGTSSVSGLVTGAGGGILGGIAGNLLFGGSPTGTMLGSLAGMYLGHNSGKKYVQNKLDNTSIVK